MATSSVVPTPAMLHPYGEVVQQNDPHEGHDRLVWLGRAQDFLDFYRFPKELVQQVIDHPSEVSDDPSAATRGYPVKRHRRGDITVVMGYQYPEVPAVMFIYLHTPEENHHRGSVRGAGQGGGSSVPTTWRQLRAQLIKLGAKLPADRAGHTKVMVGEQRIGSLPNSPHQDKREVANNWHTLSKRIMAEKARQSVLQDVQDVRDLHWPKEDS